MATVTREPIGLLNDKITVKVSKDDYLSSFEKSLKNYSKTANIPGFRKGMVPTGMIKKLHGQAVFTDEVLRTVEKQLTDYMVNEKLEIFAQPLPMPENDARQIDVNNPNDYAFAFEVGLKPAFNVADLASQEVKRFKIQVSDEMINQEVERLQLRHGKMTDPEEVTGDDNVLNVLFTETDEAGNAIENGIVKDNSLLVKYFAESFRPSLIGKKNTDEMQVTLDTAFAGKEKDWVADDLGLKGNPEAGSKHFKMLITKVGLVEKAEMNEEFYQKAFPNKTIANEEEFRTAVKEDMESQFLNETKNQLQHELYHVLLNKTNIEFPEGFLKRWMATNTEEPKSPEQVESEYPTFVNQLKWTLITDQIIREQNIDITQDELKAFAKNQLFSYMGMGAMDDEQPWVNDYVNRMMQDKKFIEDTYLRIQTDKVFQWAESQVNAVDTPISVDDFTKMVQEHNHQHHSHEEHNH
jgi:trigger factor